MSQVRHCTTPGCGATCMAPHDYCARHRPKVDRQAEYRKVHGRPPRSEEARAKRAKTKECSSCWCTGYHDPRCGRLRGIQKVNAERSGG